jgi:hypothetical protein
MRDHREAGFEAPGRAAPGGGAPGASETLETLAPRLAIVARLGAAPSRLAALARAVAAAEPGPPSGEWSPRDVVAHLVAVEGTVWQARLAMLESTAEEPAWTWTEPGPVDSPDAATLDGALALFRAGRTLTLERLAALDDAGWARTGRHATFGRLDVLGLMRVAADHDDEHLAALEARAGAASGTTAAPSPAVPERVDA